MLRPTVDPLLGDDLGAALAPLDPANADTFACCAPTRNPGLAASAGGCPPQISLITPLKRPPRTGIRDGGHPEPPSRRLDGRRGVGGRSTPPIDRAEHPEAQVPSCCEGARGCNA